MGDKTGISWTDATWNPVRGCSQISAGCRNCYAEALAASPKMSGPGKPYHGLAVVDEHGKARWTGKVVLIREKLWQPIAWQRPRRIFTNSMSDLFHESFPFEQVDYVVAAMALSYRHIHQVLTKRPSRMAEYFNDPKTYDRVLQVASSFFRSAKPELMEVGISRPPAWNVHLGTTVENQAAYDERIEHMQSMADTVRVRFLSVEPMIGPLRLCRCASHWEDVCPLHSANPAKRVQWVIVGGESGAGPAKTRPMHPDWARALRDECLGAKVPFFFKQWGNYVEVPYDHESPKKPAAFERWVNLAGGHGFHGENVVLMRYSHKKVAGNLLDGKAHEEFPTKVGLARGRDEVRE